MKRRNGAIGGYGGLLCLLFSWLAIVTLLVAGVMVSSRVSADDVIDQIEIGVPISCTMGGVVATGEEHVATLLPGDYSDDNNSAYAGGIGKTTLTTMCNDYNGFSIYAIGYTGDSYTSANHTKLVGTNTGETFSTAVHNSGDTASSWAMKVTKVTDSTAYNPANMAIENSFDAWHVVPDVYTKVAEYHASAGSSTTDNVLGAKVETTYAAYVSATQVADTYVGQVKYTMVHPYTAATPIVPPAPQASCDTPFPASTGITYMQQINSTNRTSVLAALTQDQHYYLRDSRDEEPYCVVKLADGNLWLADNLRLDLTDGTTLAGMNETNTNASNTTLGYLKGDTHGTTSDQYAITAVSDWSTNPTYGSSYSYSDPLIDTASKNSVKSNDSLSDDAKTWKYGIYYNYCAASAGSYCYGNGTSAGTPSGNATEDICPKNWRMPASDTGGEYATLYSNSNYNTVATLRSALRLPLSGYFYNGSADSQGSYGDFWSSTRNSIYGMYILRINASDVSPSSGSNRHIGVSVRCLLDS